MQPIGQRPPQLNKAGKQMYELIHELYPICRSLTGDGVRRTLTILQRHIPIVVREVPSGTPVYDWNVPNEWNIREAYIARLDGHRVVDLKQSNLHVVGYSVPVKKRIPFTELRQHLFTLPDRPDWIPYRTSYYNSSWGFCLSHNQLVQLQDDEYEVCIDSTLEPGHLTYGEYYLQGESEDEVLISTHVCHPSLCNDNLSGVSLSIFLAGILAKTPVQYSYRFLFLPGTIGAITWLNLNEPSIHRIKHGLVLAGVGDSGRPTYKKSRQGGAVIDRSVNHVLRTSGHDYEILDFSPYGYDERQYCSPGFNLPVGCFMRTPHGRYAEYHTSADDLGFVRAEHLADSLQKCLSVIDILENNKTYVNLQPKCEPQLGKRGLYRSIGESGAEVTARIAKLWVLNLSDGDHSLLDIAERAGMEFGVIKMAADTLEEHGLLKEVRRGARSIQSKSASPRARKIGRRKFLP